MQTPESLPGGLTVYHRGISGTRDGPLVAGRPGGGNTESMVSCKFDLRLSTAVMSSLSKGSSSIGPSHRASSLCRARVTRGQIMSGWIVGRLLAGVRAIPFLHHSHHHLQLPMKGLLPSEQTHSTAAHFHLLSLGTDCSSRRRLPSHPALSLSSEPGRIPLSAASDCAKCVPEHGLGLRPVQLQVWSTAGSAQSDPTLARLQGNTPVELGSASSVGLARTRWR